MSKSEVWSYFKKLNNGSAECHVDKCGKVLKPGGTTTSLASHLNSQHKIFEKKRKPEGSLSTENTQQSKKQKSITDYLGKYKTLEETIARLCAEEGFSYKKIATSDFLKRAMKKFFPSENIPASRRAVKRYLRSYYEKTVEETKSMISSLKKTGNKFSATLDEWTSLKNVRFINVNIHFIEKESKRFINLSVQPTSTQSERNFSLAGGVVTKTRTSLGDKEVDKLCFLKSYFLNRDKM